MWISLAVSVNSSMLVPEWTGHSHIESVDSEITPLLSPVILDSRFNGRWFTTRQHSMHTRATVHYSRHPKLGSIHTIDSAWCLLPQPYHSSKHLKNVRINRGVQRAITHRQPASSTCYKYRGFQFGLDLGLSQLRKTRQQMWWSCWKPRLLWSQIPWSGLL